MQFASALEAVTGAFWGIPAVLLFVGGGIYASCFLGGVQFSCLGRSFSAAFRSNKDEGGTSSLSALMASLGAVMGPGNIVGVASAITLGGSGAIFWMWVSAWLGMALRYSESYLAVKYRKTKNGANVGGAMYIFKEKGMPVLAVIFSIAGIIVSLTMADAVPSATLGNSFEISFGLSPRITGVILSLFTGIVVFGGAKRIIKWSEIIVPVVCVFYIILALLVFVLHPVPAFNSFCGIFQNAFSLKAGIGGLIGGTIRHGLAKGVFSHEAGMGTDPILAASTSENDPATQGLVSMLGPFLDTIVFCTLTAVVILMSKSAGENAASMARNAFSEFFPSFGGWALDTVLLLLVLATLSSWAFYGEACVRYLFKGELWVSFYRVLYSIIPVIFCGADLAVLLLVGDLATAFMALPNVVLCILFICEVKRPQKSRFIGTSSVDKRERKGYYIYTEKL